MAVLVGRTCLNRNILHYTQLLHKLRPLASFSSSAASRSQEDLDKKFSEKTLNRLQEDAPFKAFAVKGSALKHFNNGGEVVPVRREEEEKEYTLPHPIWTQVCLHVTPVVWWPLTYVTRRRWRP